MLTPDQLAHCADDILKLYSQLEEEIVRDVARRISKTGIITETGKLQLNAMQELGTLNSDILSSLSKYTDKTEEQLQKLFEDAAVTATEYDNEIYRANGLNPKSIKVSATQMQTLEAGYKKTSGNLSNLTRTTAVTSQTSFINACTLAEMKAESGAFSPQQAIVDAIKQVASEGAFVLYESGHRDRLDVAVRRNVMTGIGQTTGEICLANARELGCDLMEITAHAGARPAHASWQGQIVSLSGKKGYLSLSDIGYGTGDGFKGWNCRHDWFPYFEGSTRMYSEKDLKELEAENIEFPDGSMHTLYEAEQYQRALERRIRQTKRTLAACDESLNNLSNEETLKNLQKEFNWNSKKLKRQESELNAFCRKTDLLPDNSRTQVSGFGKSTSQKAVWTNKKSIAKSSKNDIIKLQINLFDTSDPLYVEAYSMEEEDGFENVCMHGSPNSVQRIINGVPTNYSAAEFAEYLRNSKEYNGTDLKLLSCSTGKGDNSFAQQLSKELGIRVKAPDDDVYYAVEEGIAFVGASNANTGKWRLFENGVEIFE
ncbi:MAG: phage minor capsid protein [Ruminococcus sp.]|uniref:phage minor capsid protein n=1 Tax=Ruminococcus sp. TaxID=41978 RepID=UPI003F0CFA0F